jgi:hypothetical protein
MPDIVGNYYILLQLILLSETAVAYGSTNTWKLCTLNPEIPMLPADPERWCLMELTQTIFLNSNTQKKPKANYGSIVNPSRGLAGSNQTTSRHVKPETEKSGTPI